MISRRKVAKTRADLPETWRKEMSDATLTELAGPTIFARGAAYFQQRNVEFLRDEGGSVRFHVHGTEADLTDCILRTINSAMSAVVHTQPMATSANTRWRRRYIGARCWVEKIRLCLRMKLRTRAVPVKQAPAANARCCGNSCLHSPQMRSRPASGAPLRVTVT